MTTIETMRQIEAREPIIDDSVIDRFRQRRASLVSALVDAWLEEGPRYLDQLRSAITGADLAGARAAAHGLKSCSSNLGAVRLARMCQQAESSAASGDLDGLAAALDHIGAALLATADALERARTRAAPAAA